MELWTAQARVIAHREVLARQRNAPTGAKLLKQFGIPQQEAR